MLGLSSFLISSLGERVYTIYAYHDTKNVLDFSPYFYKNCRHEKDTHLNFETKIKHSGETYSSANSSFPPKLERPQILNARVATQKPSLIKAFKVEPHLRE